MSRRKHETLITIVCWVLYGFICYFEWVRRIHDTITLTHWGRVTHICVGNLTIIGPDNGLSPDRRQAIIWTNAGILLNKLRNKLQWNICRNSYIFIQENAFENVVREMSAILSRPQCVKSYVSWASYMVHIDHGLICYFQRANVTTYTFRHNAANSYLNVDPDERVVRLK